MIDCEPRSRNSKGSSRISPEANRLALLKRLQALRAQARALADIRTGEGLNLPLIEFCKRIHKNYIAAPHLCLLAEYLEKVERREITRLIVVMPPRHGKSLTASTLFSAWHLGRRPQDPIITASYSARRSYQISRQVRNIVDSPDYAELFPDVKLGGSKSGSEWELEGHRSGESGMLAAGIGGSLTGFGAGILLLDDPHKGRKEAESEVLRDTAGSWFFADAYSRLTPDGACVVIMTRWHEDDLVGRLLEAEKTNPDADKWTVLHLPAISEDGKALWPDRYSIKRLEGIRANVGPYEWESLYQGRPSPPGGGFLKREWFQTVDGCSGGRVRVRYWDLATSEKTSADFTASFRMTMTREGDVFFEAPVHVQMEWPQARELIAQTAIAEPGVIVGVEKTGFQAAGVQELLQDPRLANTAIVPVLSDKDKLTRALPFQARAAAGKCFLVSGQWVEGALLEWSQFPLGKHDDLVDAASGGFAMLAEYQTPMRIYSLDEDGAPEEGDTVAAEDDPIWDS